MKFNHDNLESDAIDAQSSSKVDIYVLEFSEKQNCFHIHTIGDRIKKFKKFGNDSGYKVVAFGSRDYVNLEAAFLRPRLIKGVKK